MIRDAKIVATAAAIINFCLFNMKSFPSHNTVSSPSMLIALSFIILLLLSLTIVSIISFSQISYAQEPQYTAIYNNNNKATVNNISDNVGDSVYSQIAA